MKQKLSRILFTGLICVGLMAPNLVIAKDATLSKKTSHKKAHSKKSVALHDSAHKKVQSMKSIPPVVVTEATLYKESPLWFVPNKELDIITIGINFDGKGTKTDPKDKEGLTELLTEMLCNGAGDLDKIAFNKKALDKNVSFDIVANNDSIIVTIQTLSKNLKDALDLVTLALTKPRFDDDAFELTRQQEISSLQQSLHSPETMAKEALFIQMYGPDHPYANSTPKTIQSLQKITKKDLKAHFEKTITSASIKVAASGNADITQLTELLNALLKELPVEQNKTDKQDGILENLGATKKVDMPIPQSIVLFYHPFINQTDPDFYAASMLIYALGGTPFESRLWQEIREKRGLSYGLSVSRINSSLKYALAGSMATTPESVQPAIDLIRSEWKKAMGHGITQAELDMHKDFVIGSYPLTFDTTTGTVKALLTYQAEGLPATYPADRIAALKAVTLSDVNRVAKKILNPESLSFVIIGKNG